MSVRDHFRFPFVDLSIVATIVLVGWAAFRLAKIEPEISRDRQHSQELPDVFRECKELFRENIDSSEIARQESDRYDAHRLKAEYLSIADRLQADLPELAGALSNTTAAKGRELQPRMRELKDWIAKQKDRAGFAQLETRNKELKERIAEAQLPGTNGPIAITEDLGTLVREIDREYESYLSDFTEVTRNAGKPLVEAFVAQRLDGAKKSLALLSELSHQARRDGTAIESFLATQPQSEASKRTRRQEEVLQAFLAAGSPSEFSRRVRSQAEAPDASPAASAFKAPSVRQVRYGLLVVLVGLFVILIIDLYWRTVVVPLRMKLIERDTVIQHQEKLAHFQQLAAGVAHEIRNPLTTINARLYMVQRKLPEGTLEHRDAMVIGDEIDRVNQILKNFIQLTRPSPPNLALMTAKPLLKEVSELMTPQLQRQAVRMECQSGGQTPFLGDHQQLKQVLINLILNAAQSIGRDGVIILRARDETIPFKGVQTKSAIIEVKDNGPGIRPEVQGRLFEPFFSTKKGGTGLGLPISARIIDRLGGTLDFETEVGRGTVFRIALPAHEEE